ncbi:hypothetical protein OS493_016075 [Desmophyllum pertusum]|uniref:Ciliogenesis-associated TTC17-interacting protein n=1 Tax=Desmophyllum pertusum TaxID=174260 RepID=A0A9X0A1Q8_9CNID|nr:hypothetical protein OS493_016075 [Desmophyllum pertusum]
MEAENGDSAENATASVVMANGQAVEFLASIDDEIWDSLLFSDSLVTTSQTGREIGEMTITVENATWRGETCYLVHANSHGSVDQVPIGTSVTAYVGRSLQTFEQTHYEYVKIPDNPLDKKTLIVLDEDGTYSVKKTESQGEEMQRTDKYYKRNNCRVSYLKAQICCFKESWSREKMLGKSGQKIGVKQVTVTGVCRTIHSVEESPTTWESYLLSTGHLARRTQLGSQVTMTMLRLPEEHQNIDADVLEETPAVKPLKWEEDMQLFSRFLDRKAELADDHATYMRRHPELKALLADFLQFLLLRKPDDVTGFASEFFGAFSTAAPSVPSFARSSPSPARPSSTP